MKIGPLFKWFGSKWSGSRYYPCPLYSTVVEPYAGGAGYSLNHCDRTILLYDINANVAALWRWLIDFGSKHPKDILDIPVNVPVGTDIRTLGLTVGQELLLKHWQRTNNLGNCWTISPWGNKPGQWTANTRARVAEEVTAIAHWTFLSEPPTLGPGYTYFIDPPYQYNYQYGIKGFDWASLGSKILSTPGSQFIVCEAMCPKTGRLPDWLPFVHFRRQVTSRRKARNNHHSAELLYTCPVTS